MRRMLLIACLVGGQVISAQLAAAQDRRPFAGFGADLTPAEVQRLFDAYTLVQAQDMLNLSDAQYGEFAAKLKVLQETRRQNQQERQRFMGELQRLATQEATDEAQIRERLQALREHELRAAARLHEAYDGIDQLLDVRQQARFRVFEERMERRKLELVLRARQPAQRPPRRARPPNR